MMLYVKVVSFIYKGQRGAVGCTSDS